jgi:hypothetical protein
MATCRGSTSSPGFVSNELACYHEIERGEAMLGGRSELESFALRATSLYQA